MLFHFSLTTYDSSYSIKMTKTHRLCSPSQMLQIAIITFKITVLKTNVESRQCSSKDKTVLAEQQT